MTPKAKLLVACAAVLGVVYVIFFTDLFRKDQIQIITKLSPGRGSAIPRPRDWAPVYPVTFRLNKRYRLTSVKVVNTAEYATNKHVTPLWHMVSDSNSVPQLTIVYGSPKIPGMHSAVARAKPQPLEAGVQYTLLVEAGKLKTQTNFVAKEFVPKDARGR